MNFCTSSFKFGNIFKADLRDKEQVLSLYSQVKTGECKDTVFWFFLADYNEELVKMISKIFLNFKFHFFLPLTAKTLPNENFSYSYIVTSFYDFNNILKQKPQYMYVSGDILFNVAKILPIIRRNNLKLIGIPYLSIEHTGQFFPHDITDAFIEPQNIGMYEGYLDTIDTTYAKNASHERLIYQYYSQQKRVEGNLSLIIPNIPYPIDDRYLSKTFTEQRMNCGRYCLKTQRCKKCERDIHNLNFRKKMIQQEIEKNAISIHDLQQV